MNQTPFEKACLVIQVVLRWAMVEMIPLSTKPENELKKPRRKQPTYRRRSRPFPTPTARPPPRFQPIAAQLGRQRKPSRFFSVFFWTQPPGCSLLCRRRNRERPQCLPIAHRADRQQPTTARPQRDPCQSLPQDERLHLPNRTPTPLPSMLVQPISRITSIAFWKLLSEYTSATMPRLFPSTAAAASIPYLCRTLVPQLCLSRFGDQ